MLKKIDFPLVSVCIPTYNGARYLLEALNSIKQQTYQNLEVIFSDDQSTDTTIEMAEKFKRETTYPVRIYNHKPQGLGANFNHCIEKANGEFIKFLFQDDLLEPSCLEEMINVFKANNHIGLVGNKRKLLVDTNIEDPQVRNWVDTYGDLQLKIMRKQVPFIILNKKHFRSREYHNPPLNKVGEPSTVMFRKSLINMVGGFRNDLKLILDIELWNRMLLKSDFYIFRKPLTAFRLHPNQATKTLKVDIPDEWVLYNQLLYENHFFQLPLRKQIYLLRQNSYIGRMIKYY